MRLYQLQLTLPICLSFPSSLGQLSHQTLTGGAPAPLGGKNLTQQLGAGIWELHVLYSLLAPTAALQGMVLPALQGGVSNPSPTTVK